MSEQEASTPVELRGTRLALRDWRESDLASYAHWARPHHAWQGLDGPYFPKLADEDIPELMEKITARVRAGKWPAVRERLVVADAESDELLGQVSRYWECEATDWLSVGIVIYDERNWKRGLGKEALTLWCDYLFASLPSIVRLGFSTWSGNEGMVRLAARLGFREEARHRKARIVEGQHFDGLGFGVLREEWKLRANP